MKLHVVLEKQDGGGFVAYIPELPGCHTQGESRAETLKNMDEARELYLEVLKDRHGHTLPKIEVIPIPS